MKPHKHKDLIIAWANGANIQFKYEDEWIDFDNDEAPSWKEYSEYRIKPEPKPDYVLKGTIDTGGVIRWFVNVIFDGETHKPKKVELL